MKLRAIDSRDAQNLYELNSDPEVMTYLDEEYNTLEGAQEILPKVVERNEKYGNQLGLFAANLKENGVFIGWFILRPEKSTPDDTQNLEIGYRLKKVYWGKGFATEASLALIEKAIRDFDVKRIYATAMKGNAASIAVMKKCGLMFESYVPFTRADGSVVDDVMYSKTFN